MDLKKIRVDTKTFAFYLEHTSYMAVCNECLWKVKEMKAFGD